MKYLSMIILLSIAVSSAFAQKDPSYFLSMIPELPNDACSERDSINPFLEKVHKLSQELNEEIAERKGLVKPDVQDIENQLKKNAAKDIGLSDADLQKLNNKKLTKEEKEAIIDKILKEQNLKSLKNTKTEAGKKEWAKNYATQQQAILMSKMENPDSAKSKEQLEMEKNLGKNKELYDLAQEQQLILNKIHAADKKFTNQMEELNKKDAIATIEYNNAVEGLKKSLYADPPPGPEVRKELQEAIKDQGKIYCSKLTPDFCDVLKSAYNSLISLTPDYKRLGEVNPELNKAMLKTDKDLYSPVLIHLYAIRDYVGWLSQVYMYEKGDSEAE